MSSSSSTSLLAPTPTPSHAHRVRIQGQNQSRQTQYKLPPSTSSLVSSSVSQTVRREKALEGQKRKRAAKFDLSRFASLNLDDSENEAEDEPDDADGSVQPNDIDIDIIETDEQPPSSLPHPDGIKVVHSGLASFAVSFKDDATDELATTKEPTKKSKTSKLRTNKESEPKSKSKPKSSSKRKGKSRNSKSKSNSNARWADKCMYAELLEMPGSDALDLLESSTMKFDVDTNVDMENTLNLLDPLPVDLHTSWVALAPVPIGKRCLAITRDASDRDRNTGSHSEQNNNNNNNNNTTLRSRLHGKPIPFRIPQSSIPSQLTSPSLPISFSSAKLSTPSANNNNNSYFHLFPTPLPHSTILDCILDPNWEQNGVLHVLDVIRWKGQELGECEAGMRFWWRDTRLAELASAFPVSTSLQHPNNKLANPTLVPYHPSPLTLPTLLDVVVPAAKSVRWVEVPVHQAENVPALYEQDSGMDIDSISLSLSLSMTATQTSAIPTDTTVTTTQTHAISPDGLLLYLAEASYESGTSPLSSWVPLRTVLTPTPQPTVTVNTVDSSGTGIQRLSVSGTSEASRESRRGPLDVFERLLRRREKRERVESGQGQGVPEMMEDGMDL
ncbi:hypothetical protein BDP27DRAFT_1413069 [Rhodocollybia butyracea]|uniref:Snurportin-1 n=1 Tax=Rhodocollybia butyracea TaxID=206335 RepID=A0A9P5Q9R9_9AGAR|nr:hypothetical protein BDP27DRAFT_1413069 [Rhodocollybia butyracea]